MNTELDERIRTAFGDIFQATPELGPTPSRLVHSDTPASSGYRSWTLIAAAAVVMIGIGGLLLVTRARSGGEPAASTDPTVQSDRPLGQFVWPAPPRDIESLDDLIDAFTGEVLSWPSIDVGQYGDYTSEPGPQSFTLVNNKLNAEVALLAIPSPDGWGFVQIGASLSASATDQATISVQFGRPAGTASSLIEARFSDGAIITESATGSSIELSEGHELDSLLSALVIHTDDNGDVIGVSGGQFADGDVQPPSSAPDQQSLVAVPDVIGLPQVEASQELAARGFSFEVVVDDNADPGPSGTVLAMSPLPGARIEIGTLVMLTVRSG
jgi:hypothetical protein